MALPHAHGRWRRTLFGAAAGAALVLATPGSAGAAFRDFPARLCGSEPPASDHLDRDEVAPYHVQAVDCLSLLDVTRGYGTDEGTVYLPDGEVRRDEMASFVARTLRVADVELPDPAGQPFVDVDADDPHADAIRQLAQIDVVRGVGQGRYDPAGTVGRDQMATFLIRATAVQAGIEHQDLQGGDDPFTDVSTGTVHRPDIEGAYELGITRGTGPGSYSPARSVTREEMASFLARSLEAMTERTTVADRDGGALPHTVFSYADQQGRCFEVKAGSSWVAHCEQETGGTLQLHRLTVAGGLTVLVGLAAPMVTRVVVETDAADPVEVELTPTGSGTTVFASPVMAQQVQDVVAYDQAAELARTSLNELGLPFPASTVTDAGDGWAPPVILTDVRVGGHGDHDRIVFDVTGGGSAGWHARYVDEAVQQGSGDVLDIDGAAILELSLTNTTYPTGDDPDIYPPGRLAGVDAVNEIHVGSTFEGITQVFVGVDEQTPFRVLPLDDPARIVLDVVSPGVPG